MWKLKSTTTLACIFVVMASLLISNHSEAGMFRRETVQVSPEIHGVITENGEPRAGMTVKRTTYIEPNRYWESTTTDAEGRFYFAEKLVKVRPTMFERPVSVALYAADYPVLGEDDELFRVDASFNMKSTSVDLLAAGMQCELTAEYVGIQMRSLDYPNARWQGFHSKCTFTNADQVLVSQAELDAQSLETEYGYFNRFSNAFEQSTNVVEKLEWANNILAFLDRIEELETDPEKLSELPELRLKYQTYIDTYQKEY